MSARKVPQAVGTNPASVGTMPPEIPPPWRPDRPEEPPPSPPVPTVPWREPEPSKDVSALDALLRRRIVVVSGELSSTVATDAAAKVALLDAEDESGIHLHLTSPDGDLDAALMLADTVALTRAPVTVVCCATVGGAVLAVVAAAPHRQAYPHATFRLHDPEVSLSGRSDEIQRAAAAMQHQLEALHRRIAEATDRPTTEIAEDMQAGNILSADEARDYGLIQHILGGPPAVDR